MLLQDFLNLLLNERAKKMELLNITVGGFRNIGRTTVSFDSITALAGVNGSGKSNLMDAIDFGFDFIHQPNETRRKMMASSSQIPILKSIAGNNYFFSIEAKTESTTPGYYVEYGFEFSWQTDKSTAKIVREFLNVKKDEKYKRYASFIIREEERAVYLPSMTGRCDKAIKIEESALVLTKLLSFDDLFYADILSEVYSAQYFVERHLDASPSFAFDPFVTRGFKELELAGIENYPKIFEVSTVKMQNKIKMNQVVESVKVKKNIFGRIDIEIKEYNMLLKDEVDNGIYLANGKKITIDEFIKGLPSLINVVPEDVLNLFLKKLDNVDKNILPKISEIEYKPNEYDKELFLLYMNDGNYVYINTTRLSSINKYEGMLEQLDGKKGIIYLDSGNHFEILN